MIKDQVFSARAETRKMWRRLAAFALGSSFALLPFAAYGNEGARPAPSAASTFEHMPLPPVPDHQSMPWLDWEPASPTMKVDTLLSPVLGPSGIRIDATQPDRDRQQPAMS
ncbi:hypothetical protein IVA88_08495 [Bradyrhizobium sp. 149]|uniref:hypothetical protein n=1 Tax=Bradyrhizobium sp. 149 TaxID=2782624 RepID=UPI001FF76C7D|nr:hypothetical protein [Bradyrhizobium sp. 149]MCK1651479.1 hypothetical protein [Bradyrhizobium sp. 149]